MCPNFGHPALTPSFTKYRFFQAKNSIATLVNGLSVLKLFQLSNGDKARKPRMTKLGQGVGVMAHYPITINGILELSEMFTSGKLH